MRIESSWSISIALSLAVVAGGALAGDGDRRGNNRESRDEMREQRRDPSGDGRFIQPMPQQQSVPPQMQPQYPRPQQQAQPQNDNARHVGRMSPEERRALRRQIDQASHDYGPGR